MTKLLTWLLGRLPIGWLQLTSNRTRLIAAVGGVTFANVLIFMQLGFMNALFETAVMTHRDMAADIVVLSSDFESLRKANTLPRSRMHQALATPGVAAAAAIYMANMQWTDEETGDKTNFRVIGVDPEKRVFMNESLQSQLIQLKRPDAAVIDRQMRDFNPNLETQLNRRGELTTEMSGREITVVGLFDQGASFEVDGSMVVSDQTFFRLFPNRKPGTPSVVLLTCEAGVDAQKIAIAVNRRLTDGDAVAMTKPDFIAAEQSHQARQTPIGFVFGFGVAIGLVVGLVIVYQVLSTDVQDHLAEYATFKAIGYSPRFFFGIVMEEAICLAGMGFVPGITISMVLYFIAAQATALPIAMTWSRPPFVFVLTAAMCLISGVIATRRLNSADPADLF